MIARAVVVVASLAMNVATLVLGHQARGRIASRIETAELVVAGHSTGPRAVATATREGATLELGDWLRQPSVRLAYRAPSRHDAAAAKQTQLALVVKQGFEASLSAHSGKPAVGLAAGGGAAVSADVPQATTWITANGFATGFYAMDRRPDRYLHAMLKVNENDADLAVGDPGDIGLHVSLFERYAEWQLVSSSKRPGTIRTRNRVKSYANDEGSSLGFVDDRFGNLNHPIGLGARRDGHVRLITGVRGTFTLDRTRAPQHDTSQKGTR